MRDYRIYNKNLKTPVKNTELDEYHYYNEPQSFIDFIDIYNIVFPLNVENEYVKLANLTIKYISKCIELEKCQNSIDDKSNCLNNEYSILKNLDNKVNALDQELSNILSNLENNKSSMKYEKIAQLANHIKTLLQEKEDFQPIVECDKRIHTDLLILASSLGSDIDSIINKIVNILQTIKTLDIDGNEKIDQLQIIETKYNLIDQLNVKDNKKICLKQFLKAYFEVRKQSFKIVEDVAIQFVSMYKERKLLDAISENDLRYITYALTVLINININSIPYSSCSKEELNNRVIFLNFITKCLVEKEIDSIEFQEIINKKVSEHAYIPNSVLSVLNDMYIDMKTKPLINQQGKRILQLNYKKSEIC